MLSISDHIYIRLFFLILEILSLFLCLCFTGLPCYLVYRFIVPSFANSAEATAETFGANTVRSTPSVVAQY